MISLCEQSAHGHSHIVADSIASADTDHIAVEVALERFRFTRLETEFRFDGIDDPVSRGGSSLLSSLNDLGDRPFVLDEPDTVSGEVDVVIVRDFS